MAGIVNYTINICTNSQVVYANGPLKELIRAVLTDTSFKIDSPVAKDVHKTAEVVTKWMKHNKAILKKLKFLKKR